MLFNAGSEDGLLLVFIVGSVHLPVDKVTFDGGLIHRQILQQTTDIHQHMLGLD